MTNSAGDRDVMESHYRHTSYWVEQQDLSIRLRVGEHNPLLDELLDRFSTTTWAFVTAFNPGSELLSLEENRVRQAKLRSEVTERGYLVINGRGMGDDLTWPPEESILIPGIARDCAQALGQRHGQNAIVFGERGKPAELLWC